MEGMYEGGEEGGRDDGSAGRWEEWAGTRGGGAGRWG